jgi:hypothetical protein
MKQFVRKDNRKAVLHTGFGGAFLLCLTPSGGYPRPTVEEQIPSYHLLSSATDARDAMGGTKI